MTCPEKELHPSTSPAVTAIVLSAGQSRRMGTQKVILPYGGKTVIEHIVGALSEGGADEIIAVTGHEAAKVASALRTTGAQVAFNEDYLKGMLTSVRCGLRAASAAAQGFLIALGDQPSLRPHIVRRVISEFSRRGENAGTILIPTHHGERGHPLLFSHHFRQAVLTRYDDVGLRGLLTAYPEAIELVPIEEPGILRDMDDPTQYAQELKALDEDRPREE